MAVLHESRLGIASLISGGGTTMAHIGAACKNGSLKDIADLRVVIADRVTAGGIAKAQALGIPVEVIPRTEYEKGAKGTEKHGKKVLETLFRYGAHVVLQNGLLSLTAPEVVFTYYGNIFNQHPVPLDPDNILQEPLETKYGEIEEGTPVHFGGQGIHGRAAHEAVLLFQQKAGRIFPTESTIHRVTSRYDRGEVVFRQSVPVLQADTAERLAARVLPVEWIAHELLILDIYTGNVREKKRETELIKKGEEGMVFEALAEARLAFPHG